MRWENITVGFGLTGSHCTLDAALVAMEDLVIRGARVLPVISPAVATTDTRFGRAQDWLQRMEDLTRVKPIQSIVEAEPIGPKKLFDVMVIAPMTGNTLAKMANGITDTAVLMAAKAQLRNGKPVILAISTNDGLSGNAMNLGLLLNRRNVYFVPFGQDDPFAKERSLVADLTKIPDTIQHALEGRQIQPILLTS